MMILSEAPLKKRLTLEEFTAMGEGPPYYEFEDGVLIPRNGGTDPMSSPKDRPVLMGTQVSEQENRL